MAVCFRGGVNRSVNVCSLKNSAQLLSQFPAAELMDRGFSLKNEGKNYLLNITLCSHSTASSIKKVTEFLPKPDVGYIKVQAVFQSILFVWKGKDN